MKSLTARIKIVSFGFLILIPLMGSWLIAIDIFYWGYGIERLNNQFLGQNFYEIYPQPPVPERQIFGGIVAIPVLFFRLTALAFLWRMFYNFTRDKIHVGGTVFHLKYYAIFSVLGVIAFFCLSGVRRWATGEFSGYPLYTHLQFTPHETAILFTSAIIYVASKVIEEGNRFKAETESYI